MVGNNQFGQLGFPPNSTKSNSSRIPKKMTRLSKQKYVYK